MHGHCPPPIDELSIRFHETSQAKQLLIPAKLQTAQELEHGGHSSSKNLKFLIFYLNIFLDL